MSPAASDRQSPASPHTTGAVGHTPTPVALPQPGGGGGEGEGGGGGGGGKGEGGCGGGKGEGGGGGGKSEGGGGEFGTHVADVMVPPELQTCVPSPARAACTVGWCVMARGGAKA